MACAVEGGPIGFGQAGQDETGHRTYVVYHKVVSNAPQTDGPYDAMRAAGLPAVGAYWTFGSTPDYWAFARLTRSVEPLPGVKQPGPIAYWKVGTTFSSSPLRTCRENETRNPLTVPQKITINSANYQQEARFDRYGNPLLNSAFEHLKGPQTEFDHGRTQIVIEQNVAELQQDVLDSLKNHLNDAPLWGYPYRAVKFSEWSAEKKHFGPCGDPIAVGTGTAVLGGYTYWTRRLTFDVKLAELADLEVSQKYPYITSVPLGTGPDDLVIDVEEWAKVMTMTSTMVPGWDRLIIDEGTKCIRGYWQKDRTKPHFGRYVVARQYVDEAAGTATEEVSPFNPANMIRFKDWNDENARTLLNGYGHPVDTALGDTGTGTGYAVDQQGYIRCEYYQDGNLMLLGIPASLA